MKCLEIYPVAESLAEAAQTAWQPAAARNRISSAMTHPRSLPPSLPLPKLHNSPSLSPPCSFSSPLRRAPPTIPASSLPSLTRSLTIPFLALLSRKPKMEAQNLNPPPGLRTSSDPPIFDHTGGYRIISEPRIVVFRNPMHD